MQVCEKEYSPRFTQKEIVENNRYFKERAALYRKKGLDFLKSREFLFNKMPKLSGSILEIGTGSGHTTLALTKAGYEFIAIDTDKQALRTTALNLAYEKLLSKVSLYIMDGTSLDFPSMSFQNIVAVNLFHHINDIDRMLSEMDRVLEPKGFMLLADFNKKGMKIIDTVHRQEGRIHESTSIKKRHVFSFFHSLGYDLSEYNDRSHWFLIGKKIIMQ